MCVFVCMCVLKYWEEEIEDQKKKNQKYYYNAKGEDEKQKLNKQLG